MVAGRQEGAWATGTRLPLASYPAARSRVGVYIRRAIALRILAHPLTEHIEQMWINLTINGIKLVIGTAYRLRWLNITAFLDALTETLTCFAWSNKA